MKLLQFYQEKELRLGVKTNHGVLDIKEAAKKFNQVVPIHLQELMMLEDNGLEMIDGLINMVLKMGREELFLSEDYIIYAPAVTTPEKILCVGLNYINHAKESKMAVPETPVLFSKFNNALSAHMDEVPIPYGAEQIDYEAELVIIIGKKAQNVSEEDALSYVFGYSAGNDLSARDLQFKSSQWLLGKSPDGFAPIGPCIVTKDEINPNNLTIECQVNGVTRQKSNTKNMIFSCAYLISYLSRFMTLMPGDIIFTGTPDGVILGLPKEEQVWLKSGDEITVKIESLCELKNVIR